MSSNPDRRKKKKIRNMGNEKRPSSRAVADPAKIQPIANGGDKECCSDEDNDKVCMVCANDITIYAFGDCNHPICYKCSMKMRILCGEKFCPVCRKEMNKVLLTDTLDDFNVLIKDSNTIREKHHKVGFIFKHGGLIKHFNKVLEHRCPVCPDRPPDTTFEQTKAHLRKEHTLFYCDICLQHSKKFTHEWRAYSRKDLATHKRVGDADDRSHKGHPNCEFCDKRYLDHDVLFQHLRKEHYYCHICDHQTTRNEFYGDYRHLREHFKADHYLCEQGDCRYEEFTCVFSTEIDFKAHCLVAHKGTKTVQQQRGERQIDLGFQYSRRGGENSGGRPPRGENSSRGGSNHPRRGPRPSKRDAANAFERPGEEANEPTELYRAIELSKAEAARAAAASHDDNSNDFHNQDDPGNGAPIFDTSSDFPTLGGNNASSAQPKKPPSPVNTRKEKVKEPPSNNTPATSSSNSGLISQWNQSLPGGSAQLKTEDFPSLAQPSSSKGAAGQSLWSRPATAKTGGNRKAVETKSQSKPLRKPVKNFASLTSDNDFPALVQEMKVPKYRTNRKPSALSTIEASFDEKNDFPKLTDLISSDSGPSSSPFLQSSASSQKKKNSSNNMMNGHHSKSTQQESKQNRNKPNSSKSAHKTKNLSLWNSSTEEEQPRDIDEGNAVMVGRGSNKRVEAYQSHASETKSNVKLISAKADPVVPRDVNFNQPSIDLVADFPGLPVAPQVQRPAAFNKKKKSKGAVKPPPGFKKGPPGFSNKAPSPQPLLLEDLSKSLGLDSLNPASLDLASLIQPTAATSTSPVLPPPGFTSKSPPLTTGPPDHSNVSNGFGEAPFTTVKQSDKGKKSASKNSKKNEFVVDSNAMDFPELPSAPVRKFVPPAQKKSTVTKGDNSSNKNKGKKPQSAAKNSKKNSSDFNLGNDFPELPLYQAPSVPVYQENVPPATTEQSYFERNVQNANLTLGNVGRQKNGMLNLGNVFDFPSLS